MLVAKNGNVIFSKSEKEEISELIELGGEYILFSLASSEIETAGLAEIKLLDKEKNIICNIYGMPTIILHSALKIGIIDFAIVNYESSIYNLQNIYYKYFLD